VEDLAKAHVHGAGLNMARGGAQSQVDELRLRTADFTVDEVISVVITPLRSRLPGSAQWRRAGDAPRRLDMADNQF